MSFGLSGSSHTRDQETVLYSPTLARLIKSPRSTAIIPHFFFGKNCQIFLGDHLPFVFGLFLLLPLPFCVLLYSAALPFPFGSTCTPPRFGGGPVVVAGE